MVKIIQQETFDSVVEENVQEFCMSVEEAIEDAVKQFEAQGVDLSNIIKDLYIKKDEDVLFISLNKIEEALKIESEDGLLYSLQTLKDECKKDIARRVVAGKKGAYKLLINVLKHFNNDEIQTASLEALITLMSGYPDLLDNEGIEFLISGLMSNQNEKQLILLMQWAIECCKKHEKNRQSIFNAGILTILKKKIEDSETSSALVFNICSLFRHLVLDDDVREQISQAHEHARTISVETLSTVTKLLFKFRENEAVVCELLQTLSSLIVRNEFCQEVADCGGLTFTMDAMTEFPEIEKLNWQCLRLLKHLAGNDDVKLKIMQLGGGALIVSCMERFKHSLNVNKAGLAAIRALCLRSPQNSQAMCDVGAPYVIMQAMKMHPDDLNIQKNGCCAIRNIVSRSRPLSEKFLELDAEDIINNVLKRFEADLGFDAKSALRDLGCDVKFKEEWKGENKTNVIND